MLGSDKYKLSWKTALDSLQDPYINRCTTHSTTHCTVLLKSVIYVAARI